MAARTGMASATFTSSQTPHEFARGLRGAPRSARKRMAGTFRRNALVLGNAMRASGGAAMPERGGLAGLVRRATVTVTSRVGVGADVRAEVNLRSSDVDLASLEQGEVHHPTYGRTPWVTQAVPSGAFSRPQLAAKRRLRSDLHDDLRDVISDLAD